MRWLTSVVAVVVVIAGEVRDDGDWGRQDLRNFGGGDPEDICGHSICGLFVPEDPSLDDSAVKPTITGSDMGALVGRGSNKAGWGCGAILFVAVADVVAGRRVPRVFWLAECNNES